eukprot:CAMPEP_0198234556 /NCGR_PEP_ID=MMETSP1446-20131203/545_1 /TAXON_ID=1461542 ORGANISM="Unidentified sp, Strain CCMP2111" /NCGR_SAMPLE_ID=MMETSP1446 /ASSEMBLY_ACC=CAM_ASM_001112 /LENGTH=797 /DNA_ID=CAMNT_0043915353 /DNA_START=24 /DNA_END=2414 /DNA_ORIENTATION=-
MGRDGDAGKGGAKGGASARKEVAPSPSPSPSPMSVDGTGINPGDARLTLRTENGVEGEFDRGQRGVTISLHNVELVIEVPKPLDKTTVALDSSGGALEFLSHSKAWVNDRVFSTVQQTIKKEKSKYKKTVLQGITGVIGSGDMFALLGPSGAGKTTLLDVISHRKTVGEMKGKILLDGKKVSKLRLKTDTAYIQQQDVLLGYFTVHEYILFHAFLKLPQSMPSAEKKRRCQYSIQKLSLKKCMHLRIGDPLKRGVSGGERKRVCIALGLLTEPKCIFLDEPTSGLDSYISLEVMQAVRNLVNDGRTVICTIHQPSQVIYKLFDYLIILGAGRLIYWGEGKGVAKQFFYDLGFEFTDYDNSAEFLLDVVSGGVKSSKGHSNLDLAHLFKSTDTFKSMSLVAAKYLEKHMSERASYKREKKKNRFKVRGWGGKKQSSNMDEESESQSDYPPPSVEFASESIQSQLKDGYGNSQLRELWILVSFKARAHFTDMHFIGTRMVCPLLFSLILASFWGVSIETSKQHNTHQVMELAGLLFIIIGTNAFMTTFFVPAIMDERPVFIKERHDACYRVLSYVLHKVLIEAIANIPAVILFSIPIYFATPLTNDAQQFFFFMLTIFVLNLCSSMLALALASVSPSVEIAGALVPGILSLCALAGGFLKSHASLPVWWKWFNTIDFIAWAYSALMMNQYQAKTWWYCLPPLELSSFLSGGTGGGSEDLGGALSLLGENGKFDAKCNRQLGQPTEFVSLDLQECMLPVAIQIADSCFPANFSISQILTCEEICAPIEGDSVLQFFAMDW